MASFLKRAQLYLGLGPDDEYEEYEEEEQQPAAREARDAVAPTPPTARTAAARPEAPSRQTATRPAAPRPPPPAPPRSARESSGRTRPTNPPVIEPVDNPAVRTLPPKDRPMDVPVSPKPKPAVRQVAASAKPVMISPETFNNAPEVADRFKASQPVILNLQDADRELSRRFLDFCSGICYALGGKLEKVGPRVYLLTPANVDVSADERRRLNERFQRDF